MSKRWKLGTYEFSINPNSYGEQIEMVGDTVTSLDGTIVSQPTSVSTSYQMSSVFFQHRARIVSEVNLGDYVGIEYADGSMYALDNANNYIHEYSKNLDSIKKSIILSASEYVCFDVDGNDLTAFTVDNLNDIRTINISNSSLASTNRAGVNGDIVGIKSLGGYLWVVTSSSKFYKLNKSDMSIISSLDLPVISYIELGYKGMTSYENNFIVISFNNNDKSGTYHIDINNGNIVNNFYISKGISFSDVAYDGDNFIFLKNNSSKIMYVKGNTVLLDIYKLERDIKKKGFITMEDDMGVTNRVGIDNYSVSRMEGNLNKYKIDIRATKVDRGVS